MKQSFLLIFAFQISVLFAQQPTQTREVKSVRSEVEKVTHDFFNNFLNIKGEKIEETPNTIDYESKVIPPGAISSNILEIKGLKNVYSWEATMLQTDDFEKAVETYRKLYQQLNGADYLIFEKDKWRFSGDYDSPDESRAFASSILYPVSAPGAIKNLKIEVGLNYTMPEWTVKLLVYEKESDADIRPTYSGPTY
jgi:hypothetical protein